MEDSGNISIFNIPGTLFGIIPQNFLGNFFSNIPRIYNGDVPGIFHEYIFAINKQKDAFFPSN